MREFFAERLDRILPAALVAVALAGTPAVAGAQAAQAPAAASIQLDAPIPFDAAVTTGTLPNGLTYFIRRNDRPASRVMLRLAVKAGSLDEADDQRGLAHVLEHMAFNGTTHFKPGELVAYFESTGARLGPHVNAYTSFGETVYMLELPTDREAIVEKGFVALADFAGGMTLDDREIDKERGVVLEEWRLGLGAQSRIRDKQIPVLYHGSRYAERLPIGKPEVLRTFKPERLRAFYSERYRPDRMAVIVVGDVEVAAMERTVREVFAPLTNPPTPFPPRQDAVPLHPETLVSVASDPEAQRSSVSIVRKRPADPDGRVRDYRRDLVEQLVEQMFNERFEELSQRPDAPFLMAGAFGGSLSPKVDTFNLSAGVTDGGLEAGAAALAREAARLRRFGFGAPELDRAGKWTRAFYERAYAERDKTESASFADEYVRHFLEGEPSPGIAYELKLVTGLLPGIGIDEVNAMARHLLTDGSRVVLAVSPQKPGAKIPTEAELRAAVAAADAAETTAWEETAPRADLLPVKPVPGTVTARRRIAELGVTIVRFSNGVEAWIKPTDFKNDEVRFTMYAPGGASLAPPERYPEATLATSQVMLSGVAGLKATDLPKILAGRLANAQPFIALSSHGISGSSTPADLETALQLLYAEFTAPGDDAEAFARLKTRLEAAVANRESNPGAVFAERVAQINSSGHYTAQPLTAARVATLDRAAMVAFYKARFSNAADFTLFVVGTVEVDAVLPLLAQYVGGLPSQGRRTSTYEDVGLRFPPSIVRERVSKGQEPRTQTVITFPADPPRGGPDDAEEAARAQLDAAADVLEMRLRDVLREELGQTYTVSVGFSDARPQEHAGRVSISFGAAPENVDRMIERVFAEVKRLQAEPPSEDYVNRTTETSRREYETALRQNGFWLGSLQSAHFLGRDPARILRVPQRIDTITPDVLRQMFAKYFPMDRYTVVTLVPEEGTPAK